MTPAQRHHELERLRTMWTDAIHVVRAARPGTSEWAEGRVLERHAAAEYMRELVNPYQDAGATGTVAPRMRPIAVHRVPAGETLDFLEELGREFAAAMAADDPRAHPAVHVRVARSGRH